MVGVVKRIRARDEDEDGAGRHDRVGQDVEDEQAAEEQEDLKGAGPPLIGFKVYFRKLLKTYKIRATKGWPLVPPKMSLNSCE